MVKEYTLLKERIKIYFGSQQKFAEYLQMNPKTLSFKLNEKGRFTQKEICCIAEALHLSPDEAVSVFLSFDEAKLKENEELMDELKSLTGELRRLVVLLSAGRRRRWTK